jgi:hypothetical protein
MPDLIAAPATQRPVLPPTVAAKAPEAREPFPRPHAPAPLPDETPPPVSQGGNGLFEAIFTSSVPRRGR